MFFILGFRDSEATPTILVSTTVCKDGTLLLPHLSASLKLSNTYIPSVTTKNYLLSARAYSCCTPPTVRNDFKLSLRNKTLLTHLFGVSNDSIYLAIMFPDPKHCNAVPGLLATPFQGVFPIHPRAFLSRLASDRFMLVPDQHHSVFYTVRNFNEGFCSEH